MSVFKKSFAGLKVTTIHHVELFLFGFLIPINMTYKNTYFKNYSVNQDGGFPTCAIFQHNWMGVG